MYLIGWYTLKDIVFYFIIKIQALCLFFMRKGEGVYGCQ